MAKSVIVYSTPTCPYCNILKQFLKDNNIQFEYVDLSLQPEKVQELITKSGQLGVPVIDVDGQIVIGFDKEKLKQLLGIKDAGQPG